ncbi:5305_t:CDS:1, partial [Funneliformis geosporum]
MNSKNFHIKCDDKGATIVVAKIKDSNQIVGGYNPLDWNDQNVYKSTSDSFICYFTDYNDVKTGSIGRVIKGEEEHAICCYIYYGPCFGRNSDITSPNNGKWYTRCQTYLDINIPKDYGIDDYEVFQ